MSTTTDELWDKLIDHNIANEEELKLITQMNGYNEDTLNGVLYARTAYKSIEQFEEAEVREF